MIAVDLSKQQALDADPRANQQINITANLNRAGGTRIYFILEEGKETILDFLKSAIKKETDVVLRLSSDKIGNSDDETNRQVTTLGKAFANDTSTDIKLSKTQLSKMIQSGGFLGRLLCPLLKTGLPLMRSVIQPLAKSVLIPLGLTAAASVADARIHKKILGSGHNTTLMISNDEMKDILEIVKSLENSGFPLKGVS